PPPALGIARPDRFPQAFPNYEIGEVIAFGQYHGKPGPDIVKYPRTESQPRFDRVCMRRNADVRLQQEVLPLVEWDPSFPEEDVPPKHSQFPRQLARFLHDRHLPDVRIRMTRAQ